MLNLKRVSFTSILCGLIVSAAIPAACADAEKWRCNGPPHAYVTAFAINPANGDEMVLGGDDSAGIYRSDDGADTAYQVIAECAAINLAATDDFRTLFACDIYGGGLKRSKDAGRTWESVNTGLENSLSLSDCCISPADPSIVYAATNAGFRGAERSGGVYKSADGGTTWKPLGLQGKDCGSMAIDPKNPTRLFVGASGEGVWRSEDGGQSWESCGLEGGDIRDMVVDPRNPDVVVASNLFAGIFRSEDGGDTWTKTSADDQDPVVWRLDMCESNPDVIYGAALGKFVPPNPYPFGGVMKSDDNGRTWKEMGIEGVAAIAVGVDPSDSDKVYAGTYGNYFYRSLDGGKTWAKAADGLHLAYTCSLPVFLPDEPKTTYVGLHATGRNCVFWKTADAGKTWQEVTNHLFGWSEISARGVEVFRRDGELVMLLGVNYEAKESEDRIGVMRSLDGGETWDKTLDASARHLIRTPDGTVYALTYHQGIFASGDQGKTWRQIYETPNRFSDLWQDAQDPQRLLVGMRGKAEGLLETRDGGATWQTVAFEGVGVHQFAQAADNPAKLFLAADTGLFLSEDRGASWNRVETWKHPIGSVAVGPEGRVYVATGGFTPKEEQGVWMSEDACATWTRISEGIVPRAFHQMRVAPDGALWAGAGASGWWRYEP